METIEIQTTGDEQRDHDAIEAAFAEIRDAYPDLEPQDSEPGEWMLATSADSGIEVEIRIVPA